MTHLESPTRGTAIVAEIRSLARPLRQIGDLDRLVQRCGSDRFVAIGEASHGTHEFYRWRGLLSRRLIEEHGFTWIGVEGDWPDCWRINRWVRGHADQDLDVNGLLARFERWPTWLWANREVAEFLAWLRRHNLARPAAERVGFYGLDVYSLWDSLWAVMAWLEANAPEAMPAALRAWQCLLPYAEDPHNYARSIRLVPESCEADVVALLIEVRERTHSLLASEDVFDVAQNAEIAAGAERYYRTMLRGGRGSWNRRDRHMVATIDRIVEHLGPRSKGLIWAHNTHVGDARATDMAGAGMVNVGQLLRERHQQDGVSLVGFAAHRGTVLAARSWGGRETAFPVPAARAGSHEDLLHHTLGDASVLVFGERRSGPWLADWRGHRAIGVVYDPEHEAGNYVPTGMGARYDALIWLEQTQHLLPLHHAARPTEPEFETEPTGF